MTLRTCVGNKIIRAGAIAAALSAIGVLLGWYFNQSVIDRPALASELRQLDMKVAGNEVLLRSRAKIDEQRSLYEANDRIEVLRGGGKFVPQYLIDERHRLEESIRRHTIQIEKAIKRGSKG